MFLLKLNYLIPAFLLVSLIPFLPTNGNLAYGELPSYCSYAPEPANIPVGASVIFINNGPEIHTATSTDATPEDSQGDAAAMVNGIFDSGILAPNAESDPITMDEAGVFNYYCAVHPDMRGSLIVGDATESSKVDSSEIKKTVSNPLTPNLEFTSTSTSSDKSITGGELPLTKIKSVGSVAYIIDGSTPACGHDAFSYDGSGHTKITGSVQVDLDPKTNTGTINAEWRDAQGNQWKYVQTEFGGGNEMYIGETIDGVTQTKLDLDPVAINHFEHGTTGAGPTIEPTLFVYLASWGPAEVSKNGVSQGTFEGHMMITEGARDVESGKIVKSDGVTPYSPMTPDDSKVNHDAAQLHLVYHTAPAPEPTKNFPPPFEVFEHTMFYDLDVLTPSVIPAQLVEPKAPTPSPKTTSMSPLMQMKNNVNPIDVVCDNGLELLKKTSDGSAACVKSTTAAKLVQRGWGSSF